MNAESGSAEHFVTLFNHKFLPQGLALHESLMQQAMPMHLWIICMDEQAEQQLAKFNLPNVTLLPLREVESPELLSIKDSRSTGEYCWTLTPFSVQAVFDREPSVRRATYIDADLYFFDDPRLLLSELEESGKDVQITEHHYAPKYDQSHNSGRFCVQFMTFNNNDEARKVMRWWQERCIEWCFGRVEEGKFGDQKYLDVWPTMFASQVHILKRNDRILAPWNVFMQMQELGDDAAPVFYHFHSCRIVRPDLVNCFRHYRVCDKGLRFYEAYVASLRRQRMRMAEYDIKMPVFPISGIRSRAEYFLYQLTGKGNFRSLDPVRKS